MTVTSGGAPIFVGSDFYTFVNDALRENNPPGSTDLKGLDQAINQALPFSTSFESSLNRGDTIEIQGPSGSGKTELLYFFAIKTLLPGIWFFGEERVDLGGRNKSVVVCDCDDRWSVTRLVDVALQMIREKIRNVLPDANVDTQSVLAELQTVVLDSLRRLHIFRPTSSAGLAATLITLPQYHYTRMPYEEICMLMIDGGPSSYYWQDRWAAEAVGGRTRRGMQLSPSSEIVRALVSFRKSHNPMIFITTRALFPVPNTPHFFKQHIPPPFPGPFETRPDDTANPRLSPLEITHHITLCNPNQSPISDNEELPDEDEEHESHIDRSTLQVQAIMRTPPRDAPDCIVTHFSFLLAEAGVSAVPIEEMEGLSPIDPSAPEH